MRKFHIDRTSIRRTALLTGSAACLLIVLSMWTASTKPKLIALTFDDGPSSEYTPRVVKILDQEKVKATFFMVGRWLPGKRVLIRQMVRDGQQIGNHTFDHTKLVGLSATQIQTEISKANAAIDDYAGLTGETLLVRPPYGARDRSMLSAINAPVILWTLDPAAGNQVPGGEMAKFVLSRAKDGDIILLYDTTQYNLEAVKPIIKGLKARNFTFVTVRELFRRKGVTPQNSVAYKRITGRAGQRRYEERPLVKPSNHSFAPQKTGSVKKTRQPASGHDSSDLSAQCVAA